jgi:hypothetical protein
MIMRARPRAATSAKRPHSLPEGTTFAPTWHSDVSAPLSANAVKRPSRRRATSSREDALDGVLRAEGEDLLEGRLERLRH